MYRQKISEKTISKVTYCGSCFPKLGKLRRSEIVASGVEYMRIGGIAYDGANMWSISDPFYTDINDIIDEIQSYGIIPIIQVPMDKTKTIAQNATICAEYVNNINNANSQGIVYWEIGNEPNSEYGGTIYNYNTDTAIAHYIKDVSTAMKGVSGQSGIKIIGPSFSYYDYARYRRLIGGDCNIAGLVPGQSYYHIDYIDFHAYPVGDSATLQSTSRSAIISNIQTPYQFKTILDTINTRIGIAGRTGTLKISVTEANLSYEQGAASNRGADGTGPGSFLGGQYWAELMGVSMQKGVALLAFWSPVEGSGDNNYLNDIGYISSRDSIRRPTYWHYKMVAENFKGTFLPNLYTSNAARHKVFAFKTTTGDSIGVLIMNQSIQSPRGTDTTTATFAINFHDSIPSGSDSIKVRLNGTTTYTEFPTYRCRIKKECTQLLIFNRNGTLAKNQVYSLGEALNDDGPIDVSGTNAILYSQSDFNSYLDVVHQDIFIEPDASHITEGTSDNKTFRFSNSITIGNGAGEFTVPVGGELLLMPTASTCN